MNYTNKKSQHSLSPHQSATKKKQPNYQRIEQSFHISKPFQNSRYRTENMNRSQLSQLYEDLMERSEYTDAEETKAKIRFIDVQYKKRRSRMLSKEHSIEKQSIKKAHQFEMKRFRQAWQHEMIRQSVREQIAYKKLAKQKNKSEQKCRERIRQRCRSARPHSTLAQMKSLQQQERLLRKRGATVQLRQIRSQKKSIILESLEEQKKVYRKIALQQQKKMDEECTRRFSSFVHRIQVIRNDNKKMYRRQQQRLKQKYKNVVKKLQHQQKSDFIIEGLI